MDSVRPDFSLFLGSEGHWARVDLGGPARAFVHGAVLTDAGTGFVAPLVALAAEGPPIGRRSALLSDLIWTGAVELPIEDPEGLGGEALGRSLALAAEQHTGYGPDGAWCGWTRLASRGSCPRFWATIGPKGPLAAAGRWLASEGSEFLWAAHPAGVLRASAGPRVEAWPTVTFLGGDLGPAELWSGSPGGPQWIAAVDAWLKGRRGSAPVFLGPTALRELLTRASWAGRRDLVPNRRMLEVLHGAAAQWLDAAPPQALLAGQGAHGKAQRVGSARAMGPEEEPVVDISPAVWDHSPSPARPQTQPTGGREVGRPEGAVREAAGLIALPPPAEAAGALPPKTPAAPEDPAPTASEVSPPSAKPDGALAPKPVATQTSAPKAPAPESAAPPAAATARTPAPRERPAVVQPRPAPLAQGSRSSDWWAPAALAALVLGAIAWHRFQADPPTASASAPQRTEPAPPPSSGNGEPVPPSAEITAGDEPARWLAEQDWLQRRRLPALLHGMSRHLDEELVLRRVVAKFGGALCLEGHGLSARAVDRFAAALGGELAPHGWRVSPAESFRRAFPSGQQGYDFVLELHPAEAPHQTQAVGLSEAPRQRMDAVARWTERLEQAGGDVVSSRRDEGILSRSSEEVAQLAARLVQSGQAPTGWRLELRIGFGALASALDELSRDAGFVLPAALEMERIGDSDRLEVRLWLWI